MLMSPVGEGAALLFIDEESGRGALRVQGAPRHTEGAEKLDRNYQPRASRDAAGVGEDADGLCWRGETRQRAGIFMEGPDAINRRVDET